jgi:hypothetical protein
MKLNDFDDYMLNAFLRLTPAEQERMRREIYEAVTGRPHAMPKARQTSDSNNLSVVLTPYDSEFLRSAGIFVLVCEAGLALLLDERFAGPDAFDRRLSDGDFVFLRAIGIRLSSPVNQTMADRGCDECNAEFAEPARDAAAWYRHNRAHERHVKQREATKSRTRTHCRTCDQPTNVHLIDLHNNDGDTMARSQRYCFSCRPNAIEDSHFVIDRTGEFE